MGRPPLVDRQELLAAVRELARERGPAAVTAAHVAARVGRPSGSLYHRFAGRDHLLCEAWLDAVDSFQGDYLNHLRAGDVPLAARHVISWSRQQPARAALLTAFRRSDLLGSSWPPQVTDRATRASTGLDAAIRNCAAHLRVPSRWVVAAAVDLPYGMVRRTLTEGELTDDDERLVQAAAAAVIEAARREDKQ